MDQIYFEVLIKCRCDTMLVLLQKYGIFGYCYHSGLVYMEIIASYVSIVQFQKISKGRGGNLYHLSPPFGRTSCPGDSGELACIT